MTDCKVCGHPEHPSDGCPTTVGYDHLNGDHECPCSGPVTAIDLIQQLVDSIQEYPEYVDSPLLVTDQYGKEYTLTGTDIQGDLWLVIDNDATDDMAAHSAAEFFEKQLADIRALAMEGVKNPLRMGPQIAPLLLEILNRRNDDRDETGAAPSVDP